jgi:hypothetical protein
MNKSPWVVKVLKYTAISTLERGVVVISREYTYVDSNRYIGSLLQQKNFLVYIFILHFWLIQCCK